MSERIRIDISGHQFHEHVEGEPVLWCQAVARYSGEDGSKQLQVPAVIVRTQDGFRLVLLQEDCRTTKITIAGWRTIPREETTWDTP